MARLTLQQANAIIAGAFSKAKALRLKPITVAVLDAGGHVISLQRQDGASTMRPEIAIAKAAGALSLGVSSRQIGDMAKDRAAFVLAVTPLSPRGLVPAAGGVIIAGEDDIPLGAVGVTGDTSDQDEACALAGIVASGLAAQG